MTVYIEYIFLDNLAVNVLILYVTLIACRKNIKLWRLFASAALGGIFAALYPFLNVYNYIVKSLLGLAMILISASYKNFKDLMRTLILFYLISFSLAGAVLMLSSYNLINLQEFNGKLQLFPFCITSAAFLFLIAGKIAIAETYKRKIAERLLYPATVESAGERIDITAFYDSGNRLYDPSDNSPMVIISEKLYQKIRGGEEGEVAVKTINGIKIIKTLPITFGIYFSKDTNKMYRIKAGVSESLNEEYDLILHTEMIGE